MGVEMHVAIAGGGPVGAFLAVGLARRGHTVTIIDRDPGPPNEGDWQRMGVMQFPQPHGFRGGVRMALLQEMPDVHAALVSTGARIGLPDGAPAVTGVLLCRRSLFETTLRTIARREPGVEWLTGHVDDVAVRDGVVAGLAVNGRLHEADVVIVATGRVSRVGERLRGPVFGGSSGFEWISKMYRSLDPSDFCNLPTPVVAEGPDYIAAIMPSDTGYHSLQVGYPRGAGAFRSLRSVSGFDAAARAIPLLAPWRDPVRFELMPDPGLGANITNTYRWQGRRLGEPPAVGLFFMGDAVCTLNPENGVYLSLAYPQAIQLMTRLDEGWDDLGAVSGAMDDWAERNIRPWYDAHVLQDASLLRRINGEDIIASDPVPPDVIVAAAFADPSLMAFAGPYLGMIAGPEVLVGAEGRVREMLDTGWRPPKYGPPSAEFLT